MPRASSPTKPKAPIAVGILNMPERRRGEFLREVGMWTTGGVAISFVCAIASAWLIFETPLLQLRIIQLAIMFSCIGLADFVAAPMVRNGQSVLGFAMGSAAMGVALGYILCIAVMEGARRFGGEGFAPLTLVAQAGGLTGATALSLGAYLSTGPKNLTALGSFLAVACPPMFALMIITAIWPVGGLMGIAISLLFVVVSAGALLYTLNQVMHVARTGQEVSAGYELSQSLITLFWNLLVTLIRLSRRME